MFWLASWLWEAAELEIEGEYFWDDALLAREDLRCASAEALLLPGLALELGLLLPPGTTAMCDTRRRRSKLCTSSISMAFSSGCSLLSILVMRMCEMITTGMARIEIMKKARAKNAKAVVITSHHDVLNWKYLQRTKPKGR